jgi:hypothetical protein
MVQLEKSGLTGYTVFWEGSVRLDKIQSFNGVNIELGYKTLAIYSPREVTTYEREDTDQSD